MDSIFEAMVAGAALSNLSYVVAPDCPVLYLFAEGEHSFLTCIGEALEEEQAAIFYTWFAKVPEQRRSEAAEYFMRVNRDLLIGNFNLDICEGEACFKTSAVADGAPLAPEHLAALISVNVQTVDRYLPGLMAVVYGHVSPGDALEHLERFALNEVLSAANARLER
jgi:hypothetical protein